MNEAGNVRHPLAARLYERISDRAEDAGQAEHRRRLLQGVTGRVLEVGAGNGLNFRHYPDTVDEVVAVEPEPYLRSVAERAAGDARVAIRVIDAVAQELPFEDATFDTAVTSLVLCEVPDQASALRELHRVVRSGGELRFYEHVLAGSPGFARFQRILDRTVWPRLSGGCHCARETAAAIAAAGFAVESCDRFRFVTSPFTRQTSPRILGIARR